MRQLPEAGCGAEWNLLFYGARQGAVDFDARVLEQLARAVLDWDKVLEFAAEQGISPLLARALFALPADTVPPAARRRLEFEFRANALRNSYLLGQLEDLLQLFEAHGIEAIPFKGPTLALQAYRDLAMRTAGDLDILVRPERVLEAKGLLVSLGYYAQHNFASAAEERRHLEIDCEYNLLRERDNTMVELHWRFRPNLFPLSLDLEPLRARAVPLSLNGVTARLLAPEDQLLVLSVHGAKHGWERLTWIRDIAELLKTFPDLDVAAVLKSAKGLRCERVVLLGLYLAREFCGMALPATLPATPAPVIATLIKQVKKRLVQDRSAAPDGWGRALFQLRSRERLRDGLPYIWDRVRRQLN